jgi:chromate transporter
MQRDLVERLRWISEEEYVEGLALSQLAPGPLAAQLAMYLGWVRGGVAGATLIGVAFVLPSFVMVLAVSWAYLRFGGLGWMQGAFYGVGAAVIAIIARSAFKLLRMTLARDRLLWAVFLVNALVTAWTESEIVWVFLASGVLVLLVRARAAPPGASMFLAVPLDVLLTGVHGPATGATVWSLAKFFAIAGSVVFGSGLAIVPFLHGTVVNEQHWLTERQFLDAVAVAMITPGPVVITVAFIGYLVAGLAGATSAALGVFLPCYLFVVLPAPYFRRLAKNPHIKAFVDGVSAGAVGAIAGAVVVLARRSLVDVPSAAIAVATFALLSLVKKVPEPLVILVAALIGMLIRSLHS